MAHHQCRSLAVEGIVGIWVPQQLWQKHLEDIHHIYPTVRLSVKQNICRGVIEDVVN